MSTKCFLITRTGEIQARFIGYARGESNCPQHPGGHRAETVIDGLTEEMSWPAEDDSRWPASCDCGYAFTADDHRSLGHDHWWADERGNRYQLTRRGEHAAPPGAMWDAFWFHGQPERCGPDGRSLVVRLPNGDNWRIDSRALNCTMPDDTTHKCWVRHGEPPNLTVDKDGHTCAAGAGSILSGDYHGFLKNGYLT